MPTGQYGTLNTFDRHFGTSACPVAPTRFIEKVPVAIRIKLPRRSLFNQPIRDVPISIGQPFTFTTFVTSARYGLSKTKRS